MKRVVFLVSFVLVIALAANVFSIGDPIQPLESPCDQPQCGCHPPAGYFTCSYWCACSGSNYDRGCTFCPF